MDSQSSISTSEDTFLTLTDTGDSQLFPPDVGDSQLTSASSLPSDPTAISLLQQHPALHSPPSPLSQSYTHHSPLPSLAHQEDSNGEKTKFMVGIDEAGRGPALGPMVYAAAYCPVDWEQLSELGFNDSKVLTADTRTKLLGTLSAHPTHLGWSVQVLAPSSISQGMLARPPTNLNVQSQNATVHILRSLLQAGLNITQIFVDALGPSVPYQKYLQSLFPSAEVTVCPKADSIYEIVGAASVAAKTCRDAWMESWVWEEEGMPPVLLPGGLSLSPAEEVDNTDGMDTSMEPSVSAVKQQGQELGSGYPSDPKTQAWIANRLEKTFGYPRLVRFSWAPIRLSMEKHGHVVKWMDDNQASVAKSFASATGRDKGRCGLAKDLGLRSVCDI